MRGWKPRTYARSWYPASGRQKTWGSNTQGLTAEPVALCGFVWWDLTSGLDEIWFPGSPCFIYYPVDFSFSTTAANRVNRICFSWTSVHSFPFSCFIIIFFHPEFYKWWLAFLSELAAEGMNLRAAMKDGYLLASAFIPSFWAHRASFIFSRQNKGRARGAACLPDTLKPSEDGSFCVVAARERGWQWRKARAPALIVSVFTVTFLPVTESQAGRSEPAGAGWPNQVLCCLEHSEESHPLRLVGGQGPVWVLLLSPFLLGSIRPSILLATDATAFSSILRPENRFLELHATRTRLSVWSQGLEKGEGVPPLPLCQHL